MGVELTMLEIMRMRLVWVGLILVWGGSARAADATAGSVSLRDVLVYKDGDRVQGQLITRTGDAIVFKADRFGELRVPADQADVTLAPNPRTAAPSAVAGAAPTKPAAPAAVAPEEREDEEHAVGWERFSPSKLTADVRRFFGPWHGRIAVSTETVTDTARRSDDSFDLKLQRKWTQDDVLITAHYDYAVASEIKTTDLLRATGSWRHDFNRLEFVQYRPTLEWNRAGILNGVRDDYVVLQQSIGVGFNVVTRPGRALRVGVSENLFDAWNSAPTPNHVSHGAASAFEEVEWTLPWRMKLTQRGVWYPIKDQPDGWENHLELSKKLTETLSISSQEEIRRNLPNGSATDLTRLKLLLGLDF